MGTIERKHRVLELNADDYKLFKARARGEVSAKRRRELRTAGTALRGLKPYRLDDDKR